MMSILAELKALLLRLEHFRKPEVEIVLAYKTAGSSKIRPLYDSEYAVATPISAAHLPKSAAPSCIFQETSAGVKPVSKDETRVLSGGVVSNATLPLFKVQSWKRSSNCAS